MKQIIIATAIALAIPAVALAEDAPVAPPSALLIPGTATAPQAQLKALCDGTAVSLSARDFLCHDLPEYVRHIGLKGKQLQIYESWRLYYFQYLEHHTAVLYENASRINGKLKLDDPLYRAPLSDVDLNYQKYAAENAAQSANKERIRLIESFTSKQAKAVLLNGGFPHIDPYFNYDRIGNAATE